MALAMLKYGHFRSQIDRNFNVLLLVRAVVTIWAAIAHVTNTIARACLMVGSAGSTRLGCSRKRGEYFQSQSINFRFSTNCRMSTLMVQLQATLHTVYTPIISLSSKHSSS